MAIAEATGAALSPLRNQPRSDPGIHPDAAGVLLMGNASRSHCPRPCSPGGCTDDRPVPPHPLLFAILLYASMTYRQAPIIGFLVVLAACLAQ